MSVILKASSRGDGAGAGRYLLHNKKNEKARVLDVRHTASLNAHDALIEMDAYGMLTGSKKPLLQVVMNFDDGHRGTDQEWRDLVSRTEKRIGLEAQPFVGVIHTFNGKEHLHAIWGKYDMATGRIKQTPHIALELKAVSYEHAREYKHERLLKWQEIKLEKEIKRDRQFADNLQDIVVKPDIFELAHQEINRPLKLKR